MSTQLYFITEDLRLKQSQLYGDSYNDIDTKFIVPTYNDLSIHTLNDWVNSLSNSYSLNTLQIESLDLFVKELNFILTEIDPLKIKAIQTSIIDEVDLLIWRETQSYIVELTFDDEGYVTFRKTFKSNKPMQKGIFDSDSDFQKVLLQFLA